jgi:integrase
MTQKRNRRSGVEDRWTREVKLPDGTVKRVPSARDGKGLRWMSRYVDDQGSEHSKSFSRKADAQKWLDGQTATLVSGTHVAPRDAQLTVQEWCDLWIEGYKVNRDSTVREARTHIRRIVDEFGGVPLSAIRPSHVKGWVAKLQQVPYQPSYVYALHSRLSQLLADAVHDGLLGRNPCSRRTAPPMGKPKPYVITTEQMWAVHDLMPDHFKVAVLLGAFVGLRVSEASGLRVADVDFLRGIVNPVQQWPGVELKTEGSTNPVPIPRDLTLLLAASVEKYPSHMMVTKGEGSDCAGPWLIERAFRKVRAQIEGLPEEFSFHDLRHYLASMLIHDGNDYKAVQARMRHASARTTLDTYGHLWPDADESTRSTIGAVIAERMDSLETTADQLRTSRRS